MSRNKVALNPQITLIAPSNLCMFYCFCCVLGCSLTYGQDLTNWLPVFFALLIQFDLKGQKYGLSSNQD